MGFNSRVVPCCILTALAVKQSRRPRSLAPCATWFVELGISFVACPASAQLPASGTLSVTGAPEFRAEIALIERLQRALASESGRPTTLRGGD